MDSENYWRRFLIPVLFLFVGMAGVVAPYLTMRGLPGDLGDARLNIYLLEHAFLVISGKLPTFLTAPFFYPWINTIGLSDTHWGTVPIYALFRWAGGSPESAFAGWFCFGSLANFVATYLVNRKLGLRPVGASLGAFLFAFSLPVIAQDGHVQLTYRLFIPLAFLSFSHYLKEKDPVWFGMATLLISVQFLSTFYMGFFLVFFLAVYGVVCFFESGEKGLSLSCRFRDRFVPASVSWHRIALAVVLVTAALCLMGLVAIPYWQTKQLYGIERHYSEIRRMLPRLQSYLAGDRSLMWFTQWRAFSLLPCRNEHQLFMGIGASVLFLCAITSKSFLEEKPLEKRFVTVLGCFFFWTLVVGGVSLYQGVAWLPGFSAVRAVTRVVLVLLFPAGFIVGRVVDEMKTKSFPLVSSSSVVLFFLVLIVSDSVLAEKAVTSCVEWKNRTSLLESRVGKWNKESVLVVATQPHDFSTDLDAMSFSQAKGIKTMNGYSGATPRGWVHFSTCADVGKVLEASRAFYANLHRPFPLKPENVICVGFPEEDNGCASVLARGEKKP